MNGFTRITNIYKQMMGVKITPILKKNLQNDKSKLVVHTYSGEYFPVYKNESRKLRSIHEYQAHT